MGTPPFVSSGEYTCLMLHQRLSRPFGIAPPIPETDAQCAEIFCTPQA
jgi:hypothetical protein